MIQKISVENSKNKSITPQQVQSRGKNAQPSFTGPVDLVIKGMQMCEAQPMVNVSVLDFLTSIGPRPVFETIAASKVKDENGNDVLDENGKPVRKFNFLAGLEALRRESSGLIINCILPSFIVMGVAKLISKPIMGMKTNLAHNWADSHTLERVNEFYKGQGAENFTETVKNMFTSLVGADGKHIDKSFDEMYKADKAAFDEIFEKLGKCADADKLNKKEIATLSQKLAAMTGISEHIKFTTNNKDKSYFSTSLESLITSTTEVLHDSKKSGVKSVEDMGKYLKKAEKLVKYKSLGGLAIVMALALSAQPINRWITHKSSGQKHGAPIYNDGEERILTPEDKKTLFKEKIISIASMLGLAWTSMMFKLPNMKMLEFKGIFPSMDQARLISTATFASRMAASEDSNDLRESRVRDLLTFSSLYFVGDYVSKAIATFIQRRHPEHVLLNELKPLKENANLFDKIVHWTKDTAIKSTHELKTEQAKRFRSICQLGNLVFSFALLGAFIPIYNKVQTSKKEQMRKAKLAEKSNNTTINSENSTARATSAGATSATATTTGAAGRADLIDTKNTAFGAFFKK